MAGNLFVNKVMFSVLATGLAVIGVNELSHTFFHHTEHEKDGYPVEVAATTTGPSTAAEEPKGPVDFLTLMSTASVEAGLEVAAKCKQCHLFEKGAAALQGPALFGIMGKDVASDASFKYSTGAGSLSAVEGVWDYDHLYRFLERPKAYAPNTAMNFVGLRKQQDRINLIAYLRSLNDGAPFPMPEPLPVSATAPADPAAPVDGAAPPADGTAPAPADASAAAGTPAAPAPAGAPAPAPSLAPAPAPT
jgi:cytochrome c